MARQEQGGNEYFSGGKINQITNALLTDYLRIRTGWICYRYKYQWLNVIQEQMKWCDVIFLKSWQRNTASAFFSCVSIWTSNLSQWSVKFGDCNLYWITAGGIQFAWSIYIYSIKYFFAMWISICNYNIWIKLCCRNQSEMICSEQ